MTEDERQQAWRATYNAALTGLTSRLDAPQLVFHIDEAPGGASNRRQHNARVLENLEWLHKAARNVATRAHGPLDPLEPPWPHPEPQP